MMKVLSILLLALCGMGSVESLKCPVVPPTTSGGYRVRFGMGFWQKFATYAKTSDDNKEFQVEMVHNCPAATDSFKMHLGENQPGGSKGDLVASVDISMFTFYYKFRIYDCTGRLLYYITEEQKNYMQFKTNLMVCTDEECDNVIGFSERVGVWDQSMAITPVVDGKILNNQTIVATKDFEMIDINPLWTVKGTPYVPGVSPEVHNPLIMTAIITQRLFETKQESGMCNSFFYIGIFLGVAIVLGMLWVLVKKFRASRGGGGHTYKAGNGGNGDDHFSGV